MGISKKKKFVVDFDKVLYNLNRTIGELLDLYEEKDEDDEDRNVIMYWVKLLTKLESWLTDLYEYDKGIDGVFDYNYIVKQMNVLLSECGIRENDIEEDFEKVLFNCYCACTKATNYLICYGIM
jgi:hypothetical protein